MDEVNSSRLERRWKPDIIGLTESAHAQARKIDASFSPVATEAQLADWESSHAIPIFPELRDYLLVSDGLEASRGEWWPVLPISSWVVHLDACESDTPVVLFGETDVHRFAFFRNRGAQIHQIDPVTGENTFFARGLFRYLEKLFTGQ